MLEFAALARAAALLVATLTLTGPGAAAALHGVEARRSSLLGYEVAGTVWEAEDAARALAYEASKAAVAAQPMLPGLEVAVPAISGQLHPDLLRAPYRVFGGRMSETWHGNPMVDKPVQRRIAALRSSRVAPYVSQATHTSQGMGGSRTTTEIRYPAGVAVPAIEVVS